MVHVKLSQLIAAASVAATGLVGFTGVAHAAPSPPPACPEGVLTIITDDSGVQYEACVESAASPSVVVVERATTLAPVQQPTSAAPSLPATGAGTGGLVIAALLVGSGSIVSLLSRRRPVASRKRFRRRNATP
jgi:LPXTG-motif cell wall-anchored protein